MSGILDSIFDLIYEMAISKRKVEDHISGLAKPICLHLIKILKWEDDYNYGKHCNDLNTWLDDCQTEKINGKRIKSKLYKDWIFNEFLESPENTSKLIKKSLKLYSNLKVIRSNDEVYLKIYQIIDRLCDDLEKFEFEDIRNYL